MNLIQTLKSFYGKIINAGETFQDYLLLAIRLYWGYQFLVGGIGKLSNIEQTSGFFEQMSIPFPLLSTYLAGGAEALGGASLIIGFASRLMAIPLIFTMLVAYGMAHFDAVRALFSNPETFVSASPFNFLLASLIIFAFGPGKFSLDHFIELLINSKK